MSRTASTSASRPAGSRASTARPSSSSPTRPWRPGSRRSTSPTLPPSPIDIQGGSVFGTGNLSASVNSSGVITPADSGAKTGVLTITGAYTQNPAGALDINIAGNTPGKQCDRLAVTGTASLSGTLNIGLLNGFVPALGSVFGILTASSVSGRFATVHGASIDRKSTRLNSSHLGI